MIETYVEMVYYPTEDYDALVRVFENLFPITEESIETEDFGPFKKLSAKMTGLSGINQMYEKFRAQSIVETARGQFYSKIKGDSVSFMLHKQGLYMSKFHFCHDEGESPMGPVWVTIKSDNIERLIDYLTPHTEKGRVLEPGFIPK